MLYVRELLFDDWNEDHIAQHHIIPEEVEEVCLDDPFVSKTRKGRLRVIGQTNAGRYLTIILAPRGRGVYYPITAEMPPLRSGDCIAAKKDKDDESTSEK